MAKIMSISMPESLKEELDKIAEKEMCSVSSIIRRAIQYYLERTSPVTKENEEN